MQSRFIDLVCLRRSAAAPPSCFRRTCSTKWSTCDRVAFIRAGRMAAVERRADDVRKSRKRVFAVTFADEAARDRFAQKAHRRAEQGAASGRQLWPATPTRSAKDGRLRHRRSRRAATLEELFMHLYGTTNQVEKESRMNRALFAKELREPVRQPHHRGGAGHVHRRDRRAVRSGAGRKSRMP